MSVEASFGGGGGAADAPASAQKISTGSSFHLGMRILPPDARQAMFEIYAFCRAVDDIADTPGPRDPRRAALDDWRHNIDALYAGQTPAGLKGLGEAIKRFGLVAKDFHAVIDGMEMDVLETIQAPSLEKLDLYCDRVASAVGRLSVRTFGMNERQGEALATHLGRALQLTNILRDLDEDAAVDRLYLPREFLERAGIALQKPAEVLAHKNLSAACAPLIDLARDHYAKAGQVMDAAPRRAVRAPRLMAAAYRPLLDRMRRQGFLPPRVRPRVNKARLLLAYLLYAAF